MSDIIEVIVPDDVGTVVVTPVDTDVKFIEINEGTAGPRGPQGIPGAPGPGGGSGLDIGDVSYVYTQSVPSDTWMVTHPLSYQPNIVVVDSAGTEQVGDIRFPSPQVILVTFSGAFSGTAYLS